MGQESQPGRVHMGPYAHSEDWGFYFDYDGKLSWRSMSSRMHVTYLQKRQSSLAGGEAQVGGFMPEKAEEVRTDTRL